MGRRGGGFFEGEGGGVFFDGVVFGDSEGEGFELVVGEAFDVGEGLDAGLGELGNGHGGEAVARFDGGRGMIGRFFESGLGHGQVPPGRDVACGEGGIRG